MNYPEDIATLLLDPANNMSIERVIDPDAHPRLLKFLVGHSDLGPEYTVGVNIALGTEASQVMDIVATMPPEPTDATPEPFKVETVMRGQNPNLKQAAMIAGIVATSLWALSGAPRGEEYRQRPDDAYRRLPLPL